MELTGGHSELDEPSSGGERTDPSLGTRAMAPLYVAVASTLLATGVVAPHWILTPYLAWWIGPALTLCAIAAGLIPLVAIRGRRVREARAIATLLLLICTLGSFSRFYFFLPALVFMAVATAAVGSSNNNRSPERIDTNS